MTKTRIHLQPIADVTPDPLREYVLYDQRSGKLTHGRWAKPEGEDGYWFPLSDPTHCAPIPAGNTFIIESVPPPDVEP